MTPRRARRGGRTARRRRWPPRRTRTSACRCCWRVADGAVEHRCAPRARAGRRKPTASPLTLDDHAGARRGAVPAGALRRPAARPRAGARRCTAARWPRSKSAQDEPAIAKTLRAISFVHDTLGDFPRALDFQFRALAIDERTGNESSRAATLRTIGIVYSRSGDPAAGLDFYRKSLALCTRPGDAIERGKTLNNIGINLKNTGQYADAPCRVDGGARGIRRPRPAAAPVGHAQQHGTRAGAAGRRGRRRADAARGARPVGGDRLPLWRRARRIGARQAVHGAGAPRRGARMARRRARRPASGTT